MYSVSQDYLDKLTEVSVKRRKIKGYLNNIEFNENDILESSFKYSDIAVSSADIKLGGVFIGSLSITFLTSFIQSNNIARGSWRGRTINISIGLYLGLDGNDEEIWEYVPLKPYVIDEANHSSLGVDVKAYDYMSKFDSTVQMTVTTGTLYGIAYLACSMCGVTLGMTSEEMAELPNGDEPSIGLYPDNDIETWRDLISWVAVTVGGFATINRDGELEFRIWKDEADIEIDINNRFTGGSWSDFETNYTAVSVINIEDNTESYYAETVDNGLTLDIGANPLIQYGVASVKEEQARNILDAIQKLKYVPFKSTSIIDPCLDLGDVISYTDGLAGIESLCCVMRIDYQYSKGITLQGYGKNPSLNGARSKNDKAIAQNAKNNKEQGITYYPYIGTSYISLTETPKSLYKIAFATSDETNVELWHEIKWNIETENDEPVEITYEYYLDGVKFDHEPVDTWYDGYHSMPHPWWLLNVSGGQVHYWEVKASINGGSATVDIGDLHALLKGQKLEGAVKFDGLIEIAEEFEPFVSGMDIVGISENISIAVSRPMPVTASDTFEPFVSGMDIVGLSDSMRLRTAYEIHTRITEDGDVRITMDGDTRTTEGGYQ